MLPGQLIAYCLCGVFAIIVAESGSWKEASVKLRAALQSRYEKDRLIPPVPISGGPLAVDTSFKLDRISHVQNDQATVTGKLWMKWTDVLLQWNPKQFNNISQTIIEDSLVWTPPLTIANGLIVESRSYGLQIQNNGVCFLWIDVRFELHRPDSGDEWNVQLEIAGPTRSQITLKFLHIPSPSQSRLSGVLMIDNHQFDSVSSHWQILSPRQFTESSKPMTLTYAFFLLPKPCRARFKLIKRLAASGMVSTAFVLTTSVGFPVGTPFRLPTVIFALIIVVVLDRGDTLIEPACSKLIESFNVCMIAFWSLVLFETSVVQIVFHRLVSKTRKKAYLRKVTCGSSSSTQTLRGVMARSVGSDSGIWHSASAHNSESGSSQLSTNQLLQAKKAIPKSNQVELLILVDRFVLPISLVVAFICFWLIL